MTNVLQRPKIVRPGQREHAVKGWLMSMDPTVIIGSCHMPGKYAVTSGLYPHRQTYRVRLHTEPLRDQCSCAEARDSNCGCRHTWSVRLRLAGTDGWRPPESWLRQRVLPPRRPRRGHDRIMERIEGVLRKTA